MAGSSRVVALNMGTRTTIAVQGLVTDGEPGKRTAVVEKIETIPTPPGAIRANGVFRPDALTQTLRQLWQERKLQTRNVVVGVDSRRVVSGVKWVSKMHPGDLARVVTPEWVQAQGIVSLPRVSAEDIHLSHYVLRTRNVQLPGEESPRQQMLLLVTALPMHEPQALANAVEDAGLELVGMDLTALGLLRGAHLAARSNPRETDLLVEIGETFETMVLHSGGNLRALDTRSGSGGADVTRAIMDEFTQMGRAVQADKRVGDAEAFKHGFAQIERDDPSSPAVARIARLIRQRIGSTKADIEQFLSTYFNAANGAGTDLARDEEHGLKSITLSGGGANLHQMAIVLGSRAEDGGFDVTTTHAAVSTAFKLPDGGPVPPFANGSSIVSTVGLLTAERRGV